MKLHVAAAALLAAAADGYAAAEAHQDHRALALGDPMTGYEYIGEGLCTGTAQGDITGRQYDRYGWEYSDGISTVFTWEECAAKCPTPRSRGVIITSMKCYCLYPDGESPPGITWGETDERDIWDAYSPVSAAAALGGFHCYKTSRLPDNELIYYGSPELSLADGIHTVRIPYKRGMGWTFTTTFYGVYEEDGVTVCNATAAAEIDPDDGGFLDAAVEEDVAEFQDYDEERGFTYPRQNMTVRFDFNEPQETTFCVRTRIEDTYQTNTAFRTINYNDHIITVELTTGNIFQLEGEGVGLAANAANEAEEEFLYTLTAFECPDGYDRMAEGENNTVAQDGQIKLCVRTSDAEVELVPNSVNINVYQGDTDYTPILGMTNGDANNFLIAREGRVVTAANDTANDNGYETTRYSIQTVEQNFLEDENGNIPNIIFNGTADIDFAPTSRRLKARVVFDETAARKLTGTAAEDVPFAMSVEVPSRGSFDSDLQKGVDDADWHAQSDASKQGLPDSYSSASSKGVACSALAIIGAAVAFAS